VKKTVYPKLHGADTSKHSGSKAKHKIDKEPLKETAETAQNTALVDEVFSTFKGYLSSQFEFNAQVDELMSRIADNADDPQKVRELTATAQDTIKKRQKLIS
jgi:phosphopantothenate synthetase